MDGMIPQGLLSPEQMQQIERQRTSDFLLALGAGLAERSQARGRKPNVLDALAGSLPGAVQAQRASFDQTLQQIMRGQQLQEMQRQRAQQVEQQRRMETYLGGLPQDVQGLARLQPEAFITKKIEQQFAVPKPAEYSEMFKNAAITLYGTDKGPFTDDQRKAIEAKATEYRVEPQVAAAKATAAANLRDPIRLQESARQIQRDFSKDIDPDYQVADRFNIIADNIKNPTPIGDTAIIYSLAKIINPGEAIMEGDIRNILSNRSIPDSVKQAAQKAVSGENLTENERLEIQSVAWTIVQERKNRLDRKTSQTARQLENLQQKPTDYITNPYDRVASPDQLVVNFKGKKTVARKAADGQYYVQQGNEFFRVVR